MTPISKVCCGQSSISVDTNPLQCIVGFPEQTAYATRPYKCTADNILRLPAPSYTMEGGWWGASSRKQAEPTWLPMIVVENRWGASRLFLSQN